MREVVRRFFEHLKQTGQPTTVANVLRAMQDGDLHDRLLCNPANRSALVISAVEVESGGVRFSPFDDDSDAASKQLPPGTLKQYVRSLEVGRKK